MKITSSYKFLFISILTVCLISCSNNDSNNNESTKPKEETKSTEQKDKGRSEFKTLKKNVLSSPTNTNELIQYPAGAFAGNTIALLPEEEKKEVYKKLDKMPKITDNATNKEKDLYWNNLLSLFHEDYIDPQSVLEKWKMESFGSPEIDDPRFKFKENLNVEIVLDASGSMNGKIGGKTKMELAKESISEFASSLPEGANVALRVYGHKGSGSDQDKELSCESSDIVYNMQNYDESNFKESLNKFNPSGWTPITLALNKAKEDMAKFNGDQNTNIIFLVSDGINTCGGDPVQVAKSLADSNIKPIVNVIGFDVDAKGQEQLKNVANASAGIYANVNNQGELVKQFESAKEIAEKWDQWKKDAISNLDSIKVDRYFMTLEFSNDWSSKEEQQSANLIDAINYLYRDKKVISKEVNDYFHSKRDEQKDLTGKSQDEVVEYLESINDKTYDEMKKSIEEKYKQK
ncbi:Ca-activated chloride channel family protein [Fictibacillus halophilus]|uniref:Ca-activated chloride channel family protein n=1 Tax=Fictibacillus halophilus TaxID=1610490 RepID=A0ABV2LNU3_9BACL|nr:VWA domain-containing protein [Fictibacillus halophilus]